MENTKLLQQVKESIGNCFTGKSNLFWGYTGSQDILLVFLEEGRVTVLEAKIFESICRQFVPGLKIQVSLSSGDSPVFA